MLSITRGLFLSRASSSKSKKYALLVVCSDKYNTIESNSLLNTGIFVSPILTDSNAFSMVIA